MVIETLVAAKDSTLNHSLSTNKAGTCKVALKHSDMQETHKSRRCRNVAVQQNNIIGPHCWRGSSDRSRSTAERLHINGKGTCYDKEGSNPGGSGEELTHFHIESEARLQRSVCALIAGVNGI